MGRIRCSGSPVARARTKTTTERMARATSDCSSREATKRSIDAAGAAAPLPRDSPTCRAASWSKNRSYMTVPGIPLAERLGRRVGRVQVDDRHAVVLAAQPREDVAHERVDLLPVGLAHDLRDHAVDLGVVDGVVGLGRRVGLLLEQRVGADPVAVGDVVVADRARRLAVHPQLAEGRVVDRDQLGLHADLLPVAGHRLGEGLALGEAREAGRRRRRARSRWRCPASASSFLARAGS